MTVLPARATVRCRMAGPRLSTVGTGHTKTCPLVSPSGKYAFLARRETCAISLCRRGGQKIVAEVGQHLCYVYACPCALAVWQFNFDLPSFTSRELRYRCAPTLGPSKMRTSAGVRLPLCPFRDRCPKYRWGILGIYPISAKEAPNNR